MISPTMCAKKAVHIPETPCGCEFYMVFRRETESASIYNLYGYDGYLIMENIEVPNTMCSNKTVTVPVVVGK